jgi:hypothetical protein
MKRRSIAYMVLTCVVVAGGVTGVSAVAAATAGAGVATRLFADDSSHESGGIQRKGRYKKEGDSCVWDVNDSGPNQCTPTTKGRFKKGSDDSCAWDENDSGPDQCTPAKGRWKVNRDNCAWDPKDSGPNQCNPRQPRK